MPTPTLQMVHVNRPLTNLTIMYQQQLNKFVAGRVFPPMPVTFKSDLYYIFNRGDMYRNSMQLRAPGAEAAGGGYKLATASYNCEVYAIKEPIPDQVRANSDQGLNPDADATFYVTQQALINRDVNWCSSFFKTGVWGEDLTGVTGTPSAGQFQKWSQAGSTPIEDILNASIVIEQATGYLPNKLVLGAQVYNDLKTNAEITDRLKYGQTGPGIVTVKESDLAQVFEVDEVVVARAIQTSSAENNVPNSDTTPDTFAYIAGNNALLTYAAPSPGLRVVSGGYTFNWQGLEGATAAGMRIKKYRWEVIAGDYVECEQAYAFGLTGKELGVFFASAH